MLARSVLPFTVAAQTPVVVPPAYLPPASGEHIGRKLMHPDGLSLSPVKDAARILGEIYLQIGHYLLATPWTIVAVAIGTWRARSRGIGAGGCMESHRGRASLHPLTGPVPFAFARG